MLIFLVLLAAFLVYAFISSGNDVAIEIATISTLAEKGEMSGKDLREAVKQITHLRVGGVHFYQIMSRLVDVGIVANRVEEVMALDTPVNKTFFRLQEGGEPLRKWQEHRFGRSIKNLLPSFRAVSS